MDPLNACVPWHSAPGVECKSTSAQTRADYCSRRISKWPCTTPAARPHQERPYCTPLTAVPPPAAPGASSSSEESSSKAMSISSGVRTFRAYRRGFRRRRRKKDSPPSIDARVKNPTLKSWFPWPCARAIGAYSKGVRSGPSGPSGQKGEEDVLPQSNRELT